MVTRKLVETALNFSFGFKGHHGALGQFHTSVSKISVRNDQAMSDEFLKLGLYVSVAYQPISPTFAHFSKILIPKKLNKSHLISSAQTVAYCEKRGLSASTANNVNIIQVGPALWTLQAIFVYLVDVILDSLTPALSPSISHKEVTRKMNFDGNQIKGPVLSKNCQECEIV